MIPLRTLIYDARTELSQPPKHTISVLDVLRSIAIGLVVIGHAGGQFDQDLSTSLPNFISAKFFHVLSRLSYGVYLNHFMLLDDVHGAVQAVAGTGSFGFVACSVASLALSMAVAFVTFALIELPGLRWRDRLLSKRARAKALDHVPIGRTRPALLAVPTDRINMLYKVLVLEQDSRFNG